MNSFQSAALQGVVKLFRRSLFVNKTESLTHRNFFERIAKIAKFPNHVKLQELNYAGLPCAWFIPEKSSDEKIFLYFPGGGYCVGSYHTHAAMIGRMARAAGHPILGVTYRKAPEDPFPAAVEDAKKVYQQLLDDGYKNIIVSGDSAGGGLSLALTMELIREKKPLPTALVLLSPWTDLTSSGDSVKRKASVDPLIGPELLEVFANKYAGDFPLDTPLISPLFGDFYDFPPTLIQVGTEEVLLDDSVRLAKKMKEQSVQVELEIWDNMMHVFQWLAGLTPEANDAIRNIGDFVNKQVILDTKTEESLHKEIY